MSFSQYDSEENKDAIMWGAFLKWCSLEEGKGTTCVGRVDPSILNQQHKLSERGGKCQGLKSGLIK